ETIPDIPGFAVVVIKGDKPIFVKAYGIADKEAGVKADVNTLFYVASSTKSFTAMAAALLDREGKIRLADPITKYAAGLQMKNRIPDKITIRDLLIHTSGLKNDALAYRMAYSGESEPKDMAKVFAGATAFDEAAYGKYDYDNLGYNIYAVLLQKQLNTNWQDLLQKTLFDPLRMKHTTAYISRAKAKKWSVAAPYLFNPTVAKTERGPLSKTDANLQSAGGLFASASDIGRWLSMNMNDGKLDGKQVIPADVVRLVHTGYTKTTRDSAPFVGDGEYGLGWQIGKYKADKVIYHHGGFPGYRSHISFMPDKKIAVAVLVNDGSAGGRAGHMLATYAYDNLLGSENLEANYAKELQDLLTNYEGGKKQSVASATDRAKRPSQLTEPISQYTGKYTHEFFGTIEISNIGSELTVRMGSIKCVGTAFTEKETIRVEMIPGTGEVIGFKKDANGKIESLTYASSTFSRIP
ncbi:MAG: serine hydrolase domain-containing protein, partial [Pyrinomonadaceae bacterium]